LGVQGDVGGQSEVRFGCDVESGPIRGVGALVLVGVVVVDHWAYRVRLADNVRLDSAAMSSPVPSDAVFHPIKV